MIKFIKKILGLLYKRGFDDGAMTITVCGKRVDHTIIGVNWSEENIKDSINDTIRRACYD